MFLKSVIHGSTKFKETGVELLTIGEGMKFSDQFYLKSSYKEIVGC